MLYAYSKYKKEKKLKILTENYKIVRKVQIKGLVLIFCNGLVWKPVHLSLG